MDVETESLNMYIWNMRWLKNIKYGALLSHRHSSLEILHSHNISFARVLTIYLQLMQSAIQGRN
jgi:hypothetical protein